MSNEGDSTIKALKKLATFDKTTQEWSLKSIETILQENSKSKKSAKTLTQKKFKTQKKSNTKAQLKSNKLLKSNTPN